MKVYLNNSFFDQGLCKELIKLFKKYENKKEKFRDTYTLNLNNIKFEDNFEFARDWLSSRSYKINKSVVDWFQIVEWPEGSYQDLHRDFESNNTVLTSILYLNDDYKGGETYFEDGTQFSPVTGRIIYFDGQYFNHGVKKVLDKTRYTVAAWYKNAV